LKTKLTTDSNDIRLRFPVIVRSQTNYIVRNPKTSHSSVVDTYSSYQQFGSIPSGSILPSNLCYDQNISENIHGFLCNSGLLLQGCMISTHDCESNNHLTTFPSKKSGKGSQSEIYCTNISKSLTLYLYNLEPNWSVNAVFTIHNKTCCCEIRCIWIRNRKRWFIRTQFAIILTPQIGKPELKFL